MNEEKREFKEKLSGFLKGKIAEAELAGGDALETARIIRKQYLKDERENEIDVEHERGRHYEADMHIEYEGAPLKGLERLYRRTILIEPTSICTAHCRWCLRSQYGNFNLSEDELIKAARYCGSPEVNQDVKEVLVTGGDPLIIPDRTKVLIDAIIEHAPNVKIIRIGSKLPLQNPDLVNDKLLEAIRPRKNVRVEIGTHVNHPRDLFPECRAAYTRIQELGIHIYNQSVLLKDLNNNADILVELFDELRYMGIETHYLFHCVPMYGAHHHRTPLEEGIDLIKSVVMGGYVSGRAKPMYTAMTDIGKIQLYEGTIIKREGTRVLLQSKYSYELRKKWNPQWQKPDSVEIDEDGFMRVWYLDA